MKSKKRFEVWINEGAFFHEPWLHDDLNDKNYRYDKVPPRIRKAFASELKARGKMNPDEARMIIDFVVNQ
jgi:hypothetical protein